MKALSDCITAATFTPFGTHLIEASAGTGKTYSIQTLYLRLVVTHGIPVQKLLVVTFTEAATAELRERLRAILEQSRQRLADADAEQAPVGDRIDQVLALPLVSKDSGMADVRLRRIRRALLDFDQSAIFTIHGFCQRALNEFAFECGQDFDADVISGDTLLREVCADWWRSQAYLTPSSATEYQIQEELPKLDTLIRWAQEVIKRNSALVKPDHDKSTLNETVTALRDLFDAAQAHGCTHQGAIFADIESQSAQPFFSAMTKTDIVETLTRFCSASADAPAAGQSAAALRTLLAPNALPNFVVLPDGVQESIARANAVLAFKRKEKRIRKISKSPHCSVPAELLDEWQRRLAAAGNLIAKNREAFDELDALLATFPAAFNKTNLKDRSRRDETMAALFASEQAATFDALSEVAGITLTKRKVKWTPAEPTGTLLAKLDELMTGYKKAAAMHMAAGLRAIANGYEQRKREARSMTFDDMLIRLWRALNDPDSSGRLCAALRSAYSAALIDEFQDTDPVQYEIFQRLFDDGGTPLFFVGDPKQAIYAFRGGDIFTYRTAKLSVTAERLFNLDTNYRSQGPLIRAINTIFKDRAGKPLFEDDSIPYDGELKCNDLNERFVDDGQLDEQPFKIWNCKTDTLNGRKMAAGGTSALAWQVYERVADEVLRLLNSETTGFAQRQEERTPPVDDRTGAVMLTRRVQPCDIAILVRRHSEAALLYHALQRRKVPVVRQAGESIFAAAEALDLLYLLGGVVEPGRMTALRTALASHLIPVGEAALAALAQHLQPVYAINHLSEQVTLPLTMEDWVVFFREIGELWRRYGFPVAINRLIKKCAVKAWLAARPDGERALVNLHQLIELLHATATRQHLGPAALLNWLKRQLNAETRDEESEAFETRLESDDDAVQIMTIHKSKGLQFPLVFIPSLWTGIPGVARATHRVYHEKIAGTPDDYAVVIDLNKDDPQVKALAGLERSQEDIRSFYVAATRAAYRTVVVTGELAGTDGTLPKCLPEGLLEQWAAEADSGIAVADVNLDEPLQQGGGRVYTGRLRPGAQTLQRPAMDIYVDKSRKHASFSAISPHGKAPAAAIREGYDVDEDDAAPDEAEPLETNALTIFSFPAGARTGECWHGIFELLDFGADDAAIRTLVNEQLERYQLDAGSDTVKQAKREITIAMVRAVLNTPLEANGVRFRLAQVNPECRRAEMAFDFSLRASGMGEHKQNAVRQVLEHFWSAGNADEKQFCASLSNWTQAIPGGFMTGFIDLFFEHKGRYYILDWKSNRLEQYAESFDHDGLTTEMKEHAYFLQYLIYTVAVDGYLRQTLGARYDYDRDFGGVFYLFLRGIGSDPTPDSQRGIYYTKPAKPLIAALAVALMPGMDGATQPLSAETI